MANRLVELGDLVASENFRVMHRIRVGLRYAIAFTCFALSLAVGHQCSAGLAASEVVVAVNGGSINSRTLANHYVKLREIPANNVIVLDSVPNSETISAESFRESILKPIIAQISQRGLAAHVQCIAYSADFPTAIDIKKDIENVKNLAQVFTPVASINGLTYLYELSMTGNPAYISPDVNYYARRSMDTYFTNPAGVAVESKWKSIKKLIDNGSTKEAVDELAQLSRVLPHQYPIHYLAASQAALGNQPDEAIKLLEAAINAGWNSGGYLAKDSRFDSVRNRDGFQVLEILLDKDPGKWQPTIGFNNRSFWAPNGVRFQTNPKNAVLGMRYLLSTVLGVTRGGGTTLSEAIESLKTAASADFSHPEGGFFYAETTDIRSQTRKPLFQDAVDELKAMGFEAEIVRNPLPMMKSQVLGAQLGVSRYDWTKSSSTLLPGSLVDNLTSFGGVMTPGGSQTKLTDVLKLGAAGSSGTVTEPFALQFKFPDPYLFVHYARGACLAEAFYQSVTGPYQLLIVGDPLCQPFSHAPRQEFDTSLQILQDESKLRFEIDVSGPRYGDWSKLPTPQSQRKERLAPTRLAVQIDGTAPKGSVAQSILNLQLEGLPPGYHEVQLILIADDPINQRTVSTFPVWVGPADLIQFSLKDNSQTGSEQSLPRVSLGTDKVVFSIHPPAECTQVTLWHDAEQLATSTSNAESIVELAVEPKRLGMGPVRIQAKASMPDGTQIASLPIWVEVGE